MIPEKIFILFIFVILLIKDYQCEIQIDPNFHLGLLHIPNFVFDTLSVFQIKMYFLTYFCSY